MTRRRRSSVAANPVLIGAATALVVIVAVFLAYNANNGLPFVPTYLLKAELPSAANLVKGNEVRIGGTRVGIVSAIKALRHPNGSVDALVEMKLQTSVKPLPLDSTVLVRPRSALGLKYVEITKGTPGHGGFRDGARIPISRARPRPVEIDQVFNTFDAKTRAAARTNLREFGNGLAGRGADLNRAIGALGPLLRDLRPVMRNLADPRTGLRNFFVQLGNAARIVAPAAEQQAELFRNLDITFGALADVARPYIQETISGGPPALDEAVRSFRVQRPFLANATGLFRELRPGVRALRPAARDLADAFVVGTPTLRRSVAFNRRLKPVFASLQTFSEDPMVPAAIKDLTRTVQVLDPSLKTLLPTQVTCNYMTLWFRNVASLLSEGDANGTWQRFIIIATPQGPNNEGGPSSAPANGPTEDNHLHSNPYPAASSSECEAANEPYPAGRTVIGNVAGSQGTNHDETKPEAGR
jgi:virulence factor Mce-like protein